MIQQQLIGWGAIVYILFWIIGFINQIYIGNLIKRYLPDLAPSIYPSLFHQSPGSSLRFLKFIFWRGYSRIENQDILRRFDFHRLIALVSMMVIIAGLIAGLFLL